MPEELTARRARDAAASRRSAGRRRSGSDRRSARSRRARRPTWSCCARTGCTGAAQRPGRAGRAARRRRATWTPCWSAGAWSSRAAGSTGEARRGRAGSPVSVARSHRGRARAARRAAAPGARGLVRGDDPGDGGRTSPARAGRLSVMPIVDLSAPIEHSPAELLEPLRTEIEYSDHAAGAAQVEALFGVPPDLLRDGEGWATEEITPARHPQLHPRRRALALQLARSAASRRRRSTSCRSSGSSPPASCST